MKLIYLLNNIANEEWDKVPKKIKFDDEEFEFDYEFKEYFSKQDMFFLRSIDEPSLCILNAEVEIVDNAKENVAKKILPLQIDNNPSNDIKLLTIKLNKAILAVNYLLDKDKENNNEH